MTAGDGEREVDPVLLEIVQGALKSCGDEMDGLVVRTAMSPFIREKGDHFTGLADARARILYSTHDRAGPGMLETIFERYPPEAMQPGDVYWVSDPYLLNGAISHSPDMCFIAPVFFRGCIVGYSLCFGHFWDIGGAQPGSISPRATDVFQEGITVPQVRIIDRGQLNDDLYRTILRNSRFPQMLEGDTRAMMAASRLGQARLVALFERHGPDAMEATFEALHARAERAARRFIGEQSHPGRYTFVDYVDNDCVSDTPYRIEIEAEFGTDEIVSVDCRRSDDQAAGPINYLLHPGVCRMIFSRFLLWQQPGVLQNAGASRAIGEVHLREGSILKPLRPAPLGLRGHTMWRVANVVLGLFAQATRGATPAGSPDFVILIMRARHPTSGESLLTTDGLGAGQGARPFADGLDVIYAGRAQRNYPVEFIEAEFPLRIERYAVQPDSGGPGYHRGGTGVIREYRVLADQIVLATRMANLKAPPWGVMGGRAGRTGGMWINPGAPDERSIPGFSEGITLRRNDLLRVISNGGGGYGNALEREPVRVRHDVEDGFVSLEAAARDYGVRLDPVTLEIDEPATVALRTMLSAERGPDPRLFDRGAAFDELESHRQSSSSARSDGLPADSA
jgi:N-methylhydantoinase B